MGSFWGVWADSPSRIDHRYTHERVAGRICQSECFIDVTFVVVAKKEALRWSDQADRQRYKNHGNNIRHASLPVSPLTLRLSASRRMK
jgi:hypothetical protein